MIHAHSETTIRFAAATVRERRQEAERHGRARAARRSIAARERAISHPSAFARVLRGILSGTPGLGFIARRDLPPCEGCA